MTFLAKKDNAKSVIDDNPLLIGSTTINLISGGGDKFPLTAEGEWIATIWDKVNYPDPGDDPNMEEVLVTSRSGDVLTVTRAYNGTAASEHVQGSTIGLFPLSQHFLDVENAILGRKKFHGIETMGALSFDNSTHILTIAAGENTYWVNGEKYTTANAITCDLDSFVTLEANTVYFVYFDDLSGVPKVSVLPWDFSTTASVAAIFWNGSAAAIQNEKHSYNRNREWHAWAHETVGTRYIAGFPLTLPTTTTDNQLQIEGGSIRDEDIMHSISQQTVMRGFYKTELSKYTFANYSLPYLGTSGQPQYLDTDTYALTNVGASDYACYFVYATGDIERPIYVIPTHASSAHNTLAGARDEVVPNLGNLNLNPEFKLLYKLIFKGDGQFQESTDYRNTSSLPAGGSAPALASAVTVVPVGNIQSTTVQAAIEELDSMGQNAFSGWETPAETPNGVITNFSTQAMFANGLLIVTRNGQVQQVGQDITQDADYTGYTFTTAPLTGDIIRHWYIKNDTILVGGATKWKIMVSLVGTKNGSNLVFTTPTNFVANSTIVFVNGKACTRGVEYNEVGSNGITFTAGNAPVSTDDLDVVYQEGSEPVGNAQTLGNQSLTQIASGWIPIEATFTYSSADAPTFVATTSIDLTTQISVGMKIKLNQTTDKFFFVTAISSTTITLYGGTDYTLANATITLPYFSVQKAPLNFPLSPAKWTVEVSDNVSRYVTPTLNVWYKPTGSLLGIVIPIGSWNVEYAIIHRAAATATQYIQSWVTLSTTTNSETNIEFTSKSAIDQTTSGLTVVDSTSFQKAPLIVAAKTTYYALHKIVAAASPNASNGFSTGARNVIRAVCAYL